MILYIYSDESGVFDQAHNDIFVFGGIICLGQEAHDTLIRQYTRAEDCIRQAGSYKDREIKASLIKNKDKGKLFRSLNRAYKFAIIIRQRRLLKRIFTRKKDKQRYLDYAYIRGVQEALEAMLAEGLIRDGSIESILFFIDEHSTATNGLYELQEGLENALQTCTYNYNWTKAYPPVFTGLDHVQVEFCNSKSKYLVRAADIVANRVYSLAFRGEMAHIKKIDNLYLYILPWLISGVLALIGVWCRRVK